MSRLWDLFCLAVENNFGYFFFLHQSWMHSDDSQPEAVIFAADRR